MAHHRHLMRALVAAPGAPGGIEPRDVDEPSRRTALPWWRSGLAR